MEFLNKLYESNYFGIGLFAVISFLVVTFLVVLFFGKKDEKKRKLEDTNRNLTINDTENTFKETSAGTTIEIPVAPEPIQVTPIMPKVEEQLIASPEPVAPINFESVPLQPVVPINVAETKIEEPIQFIDNLSAEKTISVAPIVEPVSIEPIRLEPIKYEIPKGSEVEEPVRAIEPINIEPIIKEETPVIAPIIEESMEIVEEPIISDTYYKPIETPKADEIAVPNIDFDAIAKSISKELDELEKSANKNDEVKVTPMSEVTSKSVNQFSSVYINKPASPAMKDVIDLPKKIDLPTMKNDGI